MTQPTEAASARTLVERLEQLNAIGTALSTEKHTPTLLENILLSAKSLTHADGGTLYTVNEDQTLQFQIVRNNSLGIAYGGSIGKTPPFPPIPLHDQNGQPNHHMVVAHAVLEGITVNIDDAYAAQDFDFSGTRAFDQQTGYRSRSFLTVPLKNHENEVIGALQLINAQDADGWALPFTETDQKLVESLASQAAVALTNRLLMQQLEQLFESFIRVINTAIDEKSKHTAGHCQRVPELTMMLAEAVQQSSADIHLSEKQLYELKIAALMHDCGKITTPVHVIDKHTKLETLFDRIDLVDTRFELLRRDAEITWLRASAAANAEQKEILQADYQAALQQLDEERDFIRRCNIGGEYMSSEHQERVKHIATRTWTDASGITHPFLSEDEVMNLSIAKGTLNHEEREIINNHVVLTYKMLKAMPWPKHLRRVPEYAAAHHEHVDGSGYPHKLTGPEMDVQARILAIADVFEALTAKDRPYKKPMTITQALTILGRMKQERHIDPELFDIFVRERVYLRYAEAFLNPEQIDDIDEEAIPGYAC